MISVNTNNGKLILRRDIAQGTMVAAKGSKIIYKDKEWVCIESILPTDCVGGEELYEREMTPLEKIRHLTTVTQMDWHKRKVNDPLLAAEQIKCFKWYGIYCEYDIEKKELLIAASSDAVKWLEERL